MTKAWGLFSAAILIAWVLAHLSTFIPSVTIKLNGTILLVGTIVATASLPWVGLSIIDRIEDQTKCTCREAWRRLYTHITPGVRRTFNFVFAYAVINFALVIWLTGGGSPSQKNGEFILESHGQFMRVLTKDEYQRMRAYSLRGISGHMILFSLAATLFHLCVRPRLKSELHESEQREIRAL